MKKSVNFINYNGYTVVEILIENFDFFETPKISHQVEDFLTGNDYPHLIFDFRNMTYIDSAGIGYMINLRKESVKYGSEVIIVCNDQELLHVMTVTKLASFFKICATVEEAVEIVKSF